MIFDTNMIDKSKLFDSVLHNEQMNVIQVQALKEHELFTAHIEALKEHELFTAHVEALKENFERKLSTFTNRERNNLIRSRVHEHATKFSKCIKTESQSYRIEKSLETFKTCAEHALSSNVDVKRVQRHVKFLQKEQAHTCALVYDASDVKKFKFVNI